MGGLVISISADIEQLETVWNPAEMPQMWARVVAGLLFLVGLVTNVELENERKIDEIAEGLEAIKTLLQKSHLPLSQGECDDSSARHIQNANTTSSLTPSEFVVSAPKEPIKWDHSAQVNDFIKIVVEDRAFREEPGAAESDVLSSLRRLARALEEPNVARDLSFPDVRDAGPQDGISMPPAEAAVFVLRWAKEHKFLFRIEAVSRILPLEKFTETCQKVCFAVDEYSQLDYIVANGYLSYIFSEYIAATGRRGYEDYYRQCRRSAQVALSRLPLLLPATVEAVAALTFGASYAVESSKATLAWTYISSAANLCQTLGLHRLTGSERGDSSQETEVNLFWMVVLLEKSLSLRLGRPSNLRDAEVTTPLPSNPNIRRCSQTSRIQGRIYDQLYSPTGLAGLDADRGAMAQVLASELGRIIHETKAACHDALVAPGAEQDKLRAVYLKIELVKQLSLLTLILRAIPVPAGSVGTITDGCAAAARETLDMHQQCMSAIQDNMSDQPMTNRYLNWGILHTPFVPFSVLFTRAVQLSDTADLIYLDRFSESLRLGETSAESITHPYRLYNLLCRAARLYIEQNDPVVFDEADVRSVDPWSVFDFAAFGNGATDGLDGSGLNAHPTQDLGHWFYGNQQLMGLLDDEIMF
ncbi:putative C6 transcription factor [Rosellinia necatrix]|uniref:Putative C6 transcription factor n=1 Tax=Rosellinia necatrix TaxID=77044 RepID=A0A1W2TDC2_ROSNE|nr:putative C6 transcription factor [Rosellinia necatrix]